VEVDCKGCGARLKVNRNLAGTKISCPQCGGALIVPKNVAREERAAPAAPKAAAPRSTAPVARRRTRSTGWLVAAQVALGLLGLAFFGGAFLRGNWDPPAWTLLGINPLALSGAGLFVLFLSALAHSRPITATLAGAVGAMGVAALHWKNHAHVDASRTLLLVVTMLALWCALQHRRATRI
jgi:predicted RNA-binding Zn-ribbon protein involved in translation (DUF1610 family)